MQLDAAEVHDPREASRVVEADRSSIFLVNPDRTELWSRVAQGATGEIRFPIGTGIAGSVAKTGQIINIRDASSDARFNRSFDLQNNYKTTTKTTVIHTNSSNYPNL